MTKESKSKSTVNKPENKVSSGMGSFEDAINNSSSSSNVGSSIKKQGKRPSLDSTGKGEDTKKLKMGDLGSSSSSTDRKDWDSDKNCKDSKRSKDEKKVGSDNAVPVKKKVQGIIQESSLFMDALTASTSKSKFKSRKRKKETESSGPKDIIAPVISSSNGGNNKDNNNIKSPKEDNEPQIIPPAFNFYRDTLNDEDNESNLKTTVEGQQKQEDVIGIDSVSAEGVASAIISTTTTIPSDTTKQVDDFAPVEGEGMLKSCLCIHRPKGKPKKVVKWREEEELKEYHFFEMDETERVNVTKPDKNFTEMKLLERNEEKLRNHQKMHNDSMEEQTIWRCPLQKVYVDSSIPSPKTESKEQIVQEERERSILQVFYFPGTKLPDHPSEVDVLDFEFDKIIQYKTIPVDDIPGQTKLYDLRNKPWPNPNGAIGIHLSPIPNTSNMPPTNTYDSTNPWSQIFAAASAMTVGNDPWKMPNGFPAFPPSAVNSLPPPFTFPPVGFPAGPPPMMNPMQAPPRFHTTQNANNGTDSGQHNFDRDSFRTQHKLF